MFSPLLILMAKLQLPVKSEPTQVRRSLTVKGMGGPGWEKYVFFILGYVVVLSLCFPKWAHLSLDSNHCRSYVTKCNEY